MDGLSLDREAPYGLLVQGYGTMSPPDIFHSINETGFYSMGMDNDATPIAQLLNWINYQGYKANETDDFFPNPYVTTNTTLFLASMEKYYLPMGPNAMDLKHNPSLWEYQEDIEWDQQIAYESYEDSRYRPIPLIWGDNDSIYTCTLNDFDGYMLKIVSWNSSGIINWTTYWYNSSAWGYQLRDIWGDQDNIYISFSEQRSNSRFLTSILKIAKNGTILQYGAYQNASRADYNNAIVGNDQYLYTFGWYENSGGYIFPQLVCWDKNTILPLWNKTIAGIQGFGLGLWLDEEGFIYCYGEKYIEGYQHFVVKINLNTLDQVWLQTWYKGDTNNSPKSLYLFNNTLYLFTQDYTYDELSFVGINPLNGNIEFNNLLEFPGKILMDRFVFYDGFFYLDIVIKVMPGFYIPSPYSYGYDYINPTYRHSILRVDILGRIKDQWLCRSNELYKPWFGKGIAISKGILYSTIMRETAMYEVTEPESRLIKWAISVITYKPKIPAPRTTNRTINESQIQFEWSGDVGAINYRVYINGSLNQTVTNTSALLTFPGNGSYIIRVSAWNASGESNQSFPIEIKVELPYVLAPPIAPIISTVNQTINGTQLNFTWNAVEGAISYKLYINGILNQTVTNTSLMIVFPGNGTYFITLVAVNAAGDSIPSPAIEIIVAILPDIPPDIPTDEETTLTEELIVGITIVGTSVGLVGASVLSPDKIKDLLETRKYVTQQDAGSTSNYLTKGDTTPTSVDGATSIISTELTPTPPPPGLTNADFLEMIKKLKMLWDKVPFEYRQLISKAIDKYYLFKDQATILIFGSFKGLSNNFFNACDLIRKGEFQDALLKLDDVSKQAAEKKFVDLAEEAQNLAIEKCKGGKC